MTDEEQEAGSIKFAGAHTVIMAKLSSGNFALYQIGGMSSPFWIGPASELANAYSARPAYSYKPQPPEPSAKAAALGVTFNL